MDEPTLPARRRSIGAPTKYSAAVHQAVVEAVESGVPITHAATIAGLSFESLCQYRRVHPGFDREVREAIARGIQSRLAVVRRAMESQDENTALRAATWWLTHTPEAARHFSESAKLEVTGDGLGNQIAVLVWPHMLSKDEQQEIIADHHPAIASPATG